MKRFLLIPSCALLAFGMLTSCQKEEKSAQQLADELTAELQKVTDYKTAEAVAPRVEALNKRFQNASVRVFSGDNNALAASQPGAYSDSVCRLVREIGRVQASKPVTASDGEVDDASLVAAVGVGAGAPSTSPTQDQFAKGQIYIFNGDSESNNNPPAFPPCYGSEKLAAALSYVATTEENGAFKFAAPEDVPAIPDAVEVEAAEVPSMDSIPDEDVVATSPAAADEEEPAAADEEPAADDEPATADEEPVDDIEPVTADEEPVADDEPVTADEEPAAADEEPAAADEEPAAADEEPAADDSEEIDDAAGEEELGGEDELGGEEDLEIEI